MLDKLKRWLAPELYHTGYQPSKSEGGSSTPPNQDSGASTEKKKRKELSPKEKATAAGEPYVAILNIDLDPADVNNGSFELDWNDKFLVTLIRKGYKIKNDDTDNDIVDRWFTDMCRSIVLETYEQTQADPDNRDNMRVISRRDLGGGYSEVS